MNIKMIKDEYGNDILIERKTCNGGEEVFYYYDGKLISHEKEGEFDKDWDLDGNLETEIYFKDGVKHGVEASYEDGKLTAYFVFYNGELIQTGKKILNQELLDKLKEE